MFSIEAERKGALKRKFPKAKAKSNEKDSKANERKIINTTPISTALVSTQLKIYNEIHPTKNGDLDKKSLTFASDKKIWWKCTNHKDCNKHEWKETPIERAKGNNCIWCFGLKYCGCDLPYKVRKGIVLFRDKYPDLVHEITEALNPEINLHTLSYGCDRKVTWRCRDGDCDHHIWETRVINRRPCGFCDGYKFCICTSFAMAHPEMAAQVNLAMHPGIDLKSLHPRSGDILNWICTNSKVKCDHHRWAVSVRSRVVFESDCPFCAHVVICSCDSFATQRPDLLKEVDMSIHGDIDFKSIGPRSDKLIYWVCSRHTTCNEHRWRATINDRNGVNNYNCPFCSHRRICPCVSLETLFPDIACEIDRELCKIDPLTLGVYSNKPINWKCGDCDYKWIATVYSRTKAKRCPKCRLSSLERAVKDVLNKLGIKYKIQYKFDDCRNINPLPFDFYLPDLDALIEVDGPHHFIEIYRGDGKPRLTLQIKKDTTKTKFTERKNKNFLRISYTEKNIETYTTTFVVLCLFRKYFGGARLEKFYGKEYNEEYKRTHS